MIPPVELLEKLLRVASRLPGVASVGFFNLNKLRIATVGAQ